MDCLFCQLVLGLICFIFLMIGFAKKSAYQFKMTTFSFGAIIIVLVSIPFMIFRPKDYRNAFFPAWGCRVLAKNLGVTMEVRGLENVKKDHGSIILLNHQSALDLLCLAYLWPFIGRATVVAKREILYIPFFGFGSWLWGTLFINRSSRKHAIESLKKQSKAVNELHCKLLLFPEGTRNLGNDKLLPFKKGPFHIAVDNQAPIQPVVVSKYSFMNHKKNTFDRGHVILQILPEISTIGYTADNMSGLIDQCRDIMQSKFTEISEDAKLLTIKKILKND